MGSRARFAWIAAALLLTGLAALEARQLDSYYLAQDRLPLWDIRNRATGPPLHRPLPGSPLWSSEDYRSYNAPQLAAFPALAADPGLRLTARRTFPEVQLEVLVFAWESGDTTDRWNPGGGEPPRP